MQPQAPSPLYLGPTVSEAAADRLKEIHRQITELQLERRQVLDRLAKYKGSTMLESERIATKAEPYQKVQLREQPCPNGQGATTGNLYDL